MASTLMRVSRPVVTMVVVVEVIALALMRADVAVMLVVKTRPIKQNDNNPPSS
jgi:hypothetical protein